MKIQLTIAAAVIVLAGCATKVGGIVPRADGVYQVSATSDDKADALAGALKSAEDTCAKRKLRHVVTDTQTKFKGTLAEDTTRTINKIGGFVGLNISSDDDYEVDLTFRCEA